MDSGHSKASRASHVSGGSKHSLVKSIREALSVKTVAVSAYAASKTTSKIAPTSPSSLGSPRVSNPDAGPPDATAGGAAEVTTSSLKNRGPMKGARIGATDAAANATTTTVATAAGGGTAVAIAGNGAHDDAQDDAQDDDPAESSSGAVTSSRGKWGYALANGTVGVYEKSKRVWRVKNKHQVCSTTGATVTTDVTTTVTSLIAVLVWFQWCCSSYSAVAAASADTVVVRGCCCCVCTYSGFV